MAAFIRGRAVSFNEMGLSLRQIAHRLNVPKSCVHDWIKDYKETGNFIPRMSTGRRKKTTDRSDRRLVRLANVDPKISANRLNHQWGEEVSVSTVYRRLASKLIRKYRMLVKPMRTMRNCQMREAWAMNHCFWDDRRWSRVVFTDESRFRLHLNDGRVMVWRRRGQRLNERFISKHVMGGGGSVLVWGGIWKGGRSNLRVLRMNVKGDNYCETLDTLMRDPNLPCNWILQDDNAKPHRCAVVNKFKELNGIKSLSSWPSFSSDLNVIEHVWDYIGRRVQDRYPENLKDLENFLNEEWNQMSQDYIDNLIISIRRRLQAVIVARGGSTNY